MKFRRAILFLLFFVLATQSLFAPSAHAQAACTPNLQFLGYKGFQDNSLFAPWQKFRVTFVVQNNSACAWGNDYSIVFVSGERMLAQAEPIRLPALQPSGVSDVSIELTAPKTFGTHQGTWRLYVPQPFGAAYGDKLFVRILVVAPQIAETAQAVQTATAAPTQTDEPPTPITIPSFEPTEVIFPIALPSPTAVSLTAISDETPTRISITATPIFITATPDVGIGSSANTYTQLPSSGFGEDLLLVLGIGVLLLGAFFVITRMRVRPSAPNASVTQTANPAQLSPYILPMPQPLAGNVILQNRYRIVRPLGSGGQASVYLAQHLGLGGKYVALKQNVGGDPRRFQEEAILLANLMHPNLPRVLDHFVEPNGAAYLVMDFIDGQDLDSFVAQRGALNESAALQWLRPVFGAVKYLHANGIIHRDIKPANIILTPQGRAMLVDFGIAKTLARGNLTATSARGIGTPGYAPPEQYVGGTTERSDIYALGATLYYVLTARVLVESPNRAAGVPMVSARQINGAVSARTDSALAVAINLDAQQRFASVALMEQALY